MTACSTPPAAAPAATSAPAAAQGQGGAASGTPIKIGYEADANGTSAPIAAGMHLGTDHAYGQSQLKAYGDALGQAGASITLPIPVPQNEPNLAPYVTKIPTDGSVNGVIINGLGAGDLTRVSLALGQYGIAPKVQVIGNSGRDVYGGSYPDFLKGTVAAPQPYISGQPPNNPYGDA